MELYDFVKLIEDDEDLKRNNISKGCVGTTVSYIDATDEWIVMFLDPYDYGDFAVAKVKADKLKFAYKRDISTIEGYKKFINNSDFYTHVSLKPPKFKEYDHVCLICDKPEYSKEGVHKGDDGCVMFSHSIHRKWDVLFSEKGTGEDIAEIMVCEDDLELLHRIDD